MAVIVIAQVRWASVVTIVAGITVLTTKMQTVGDNCDPEVYRVIYLYIANFFLQFL
jgi:hypothetical protein